MDLILKLYLIGLLFNLVVLIYHFVKEYRMVDLNIIGAVLFISLSWLIYPLIIVGARKY